MAQTSRCMAVAALTVDFLYRYFLFKWPSRAFVLSYTCIMSFYCTLPKSPRYLYIFRLNSIQSLLLRVSQGRENATLPRARPTVLQVSYNDDGMFDGDHVVCNNDSEHKGVIHIGCDPSLSLNIRSVLTLFITMS